MNIDSAAIAVEAPSPKESRLPSGLPAAAFIYAGVVVGAILGLYEAVLLYTRPPYSIMERADLGPLVFLAAPLVDVLVFGLWGCALGYLAGKARSASGWYLQCLCAAGLGSAGSFAGGVCFFRFWWDQHPTLLRLAAVVAAGALVVSIASLAVLRKAEQRRAGFVGYALVQNYRWIRLAALAIGVVLIGSTATYELRGVGSIFPPSSPSSLAGAGPNIVLITIDTAAANHFSCYGYSRETTPNIDRLAQRGVLFENAIAPSSWTLPSFSSIFTGLLPHQHGASGTSPLSPRFPTLAAYLDRKGYQTAGFNANLVYGQTSQGVANGFAVYVDGSESLGQNFTQTLVGRTFVRYAYLPHILPNPVGRRTAEQLDRKVLRWFGRRSGRPYFLFVNYFDVHYPYLPPPAFAHRFGELPHLAAKQIDDDLYGPVHHSLTVAQRSSLVAAYDNALAYTDSQIGNLVENLAKSPDWSNTVVIIAADHGESFGEHGHYQHGWNLAREVVHVPLIIFGPGIPVGVRIGRLIGTRRLYPTILELAKVSAQTSTGLSSLQNVWSGKQVSNAPVTGVISEVDVPTLDPRLQNAYISVTTPQWQWVMDAHGQRQLFDWVKDPQEKVNLAGSPDANAIMQALQQTVRERVKKSRGPWEGLSYLQPLGLGRPSIIKSPGRDALESLPYQ